MLKYIKHHMSGIDGVEIYPIISLIIFVLFFAAVTVYILKMDKAHVTEVENYPLKDSNDEIN